MKIIQILFKLSKCEVNDMIHENDILIIPDKYKNMSIEKLNIEKDKMLKEIKTQDRNKKQIKENKNNIVFNF